MQAAAQDASSPTIQSPCIGNCGIDAATGLCPGCARTRDEVARWRTASPAERARVWEALPNRRAAAGLGMHRLNWGVDEIRSFVSATLRPGGGTWVCGPYGAVAEFCVGEGEALDVSVTRTGVRARTPRGAIAFTLHEHVRTLAFGTGSGPIGSEIMVLAVKREAAAERTPGLTRLGLDVEAVNDAGRSETLYDFGLPNVVGKFGIRTAQPDLMKTLDACVGLNWSTLFTLVGSDIVQASPTRVARHPIGRIEVFTPIPFPGGRSPAGPHTHFLPAYLTFGGDLPPALALPDVYAACAVYYPEKAGQAGHHDTDDETAGDHR